MGLMEKFQGGLERIVGPVAEKVAENKFITAMTAGFMCTMPITLGIAAIAVLVNFPISAWTSFLQSTGIYAVAQDVLTVTLSMLAIYVVVAIGYSYAKNDKKNGMTGAILSMGSFLVLVPVEHISNEAGVSQTMLSTSYLGSDGIFIALIVGLFVSWAYCLLTDKNLQIKMPDSVPPMVSQAISPMLIAMIVFVFMFILKYICSMTPYGNIFTIINTLIGKPVTSIGSSPVALMTVYFLMNLFWFFGVHPNAILMCYMPVLMAATAENTQAFLDGTQLPYYMFAVLGGICQIGGAGNTLGLCIATLFAKSEKYKAMRKVFIPANIFNINEPIIFGFPIMMNPIYFIPMVFSPIISGLAGMLLMSFIKVNFNPTISMPWVTPGFMTVFLQGGISYLFFWLVALLIHFAIYLPFFKIDDAKACRMEQEADN